MNIEKFKKDCCLSMVFLAVPLIFLPGCAEDPAPAPQVTAAKPRATKKKMVAQPKEEELSQEKKFKYFYDPSGKKDPFYPAVEIEKKSADEEETKIDDGPPRTEAEMYELSQLKLVAVMKMGSKSVAMVETPGGKGLTLYIGSSIGRNRGVITEIVGNVVKIEERSRTVAGKVRSTSRELKMKAPEGGK